MASVAKRTWTYKGEARTAWVVRYKDKGGAHRSRQFDLKKDADRYRTKVEGELATGSHIAHSARTVSDLIREFQDRTDDKITRGERGRGYRASLAMLARHAGPKIGNIRLTDLRWQDVEAWGEGLRKSESRFGRTLSITTVRNLLGSFSTVLNYGVRRGYLARNIVPDASRELELPPSAKIVPFTLAEMQALIAGIEVRPKFKPARSQAMMRAMVYLAAVCGLRRGEIFALTWDSFAGGVVQVRRSMTQHGVLKAPKTNAGVRDVPLPAPVVAALEAWRPFSLPNPEGLVFTGRGGERISVSTFYIAIWRPCLEAAGLAPETPGEDWRHFHALRHFAGSAWLAAGVPLTEVSVLMGHADPGVTARVYAHAIVGPQHRVAELAGCAANIMAPPPLQLAQGAQELRNAA